MNSGDLTAVAGKIARVLATKPQCFITHPSELRVLRDLTANQLRRFAAERGWRCVRRIGGRQIEFYGDASLREQSDAI
jgi:hypothetical protein